jgi:hypothetical protein
MALKICILKGIKQMLSYPSKRVVLLHAMEAPWVTGAIAPTLS